MSPRENRAGAPAGPEPAQGVPASAEGLDEPAAWGEVLRSWADEARHEAYLARFADLDGLAVAGRRYRDALAARFRDEILRRAMVKGLASLPRTSPEPARGRLAVFIAAGGLAAGLAVAAALLARGLGLFSGARP